MKFEIEKTKEGINITSSSKPFIFIPDKDLVNEFHIRQYINVSLTNNTIDFEKLIPIIANIKEIGITKHEIPDVITEEFGLWKFGNEARIYYRDHIIWQEKKFIDNFDKKEDFKNYINEKIINNIKDMPNIDRNLIFYIPINLYIEEYNNDINSVIVFIKWNASKHDNDYTIDIDSLKNNKNHRRILSIITDAVNTLTFNFDNKEIINKYLFELWKIQKEQSMIIVGYKAEPKDFEEEPTKIIYKKQLLTPLSENIIENPLEEMAKTESGITEEVLKVPNKVRDKGINWNIIIPLLIFLVILLLVIVSIIIYIPCLLWAIYIMKHNNRPFTWWVLTGFPYVLLWKKIN